MGNADSASASKPTQVTDRRAFERPTMVLRVGLLRFEGKSAFCLLRNISPSGVQVKLYVPVYKGAEVELQVGDEGHLAGHVVWVRNGLAGIAFKTALNPATLLRVRQMGATQRRRSSPRAQACEFAILRTGGQEYCSKLCDISASGAKIQSNRPIEPGRTAVLLLPKLPALRSYVRWTDGQDAGLIFETPIPIQIISGWLVEQANVTVS